MSLHANFARLPAFLAHLERIEPEAQKDAFVNEVMETGGTYMTPQPDTESSHMVELNLHGVVAWGSDEAEAIRNWKKAARRQLPDIEGDGFITVHPPVSPFAHRVQP
ncbi:hypothetical protein [Thalassovita aquimarina]|uniref:YCII-related domain-containing protein n=1 Tax=Thalassovita aquimarina TaxID=2785917 RepID=A0ABS5HTG6_9RHOB|nr:hypothetical protein [Thalassovita aquimarina]MBR9651888.1 hypothetical protein [Thalassovita aquimarina]